MNPQKIRQKHNKQNKKQVPKKCWKRNKSLKVAKTSWLSRYKRSRSSKINYMFVPPKNETKNNIPADPGHI